MIEEWKEVSGFERFYLVSNTGRVKSMSKFKGTNFSVFCPEKEMKIRDNGLGYMIITLRNNSFIKRFYIHRLVAMLFISNPENKKEVNHKDGNKSNNDYSNLEWSTRLENEAHAWSTGLKTNKNEGNKRSKPVIQMSLDGTFIKEWPSISELSRQFGYATGHISKCCKGKFSSMYGFKWAYK